MSERRYTATDLAEAYALGVQHERERAAGALYELDLYWLRNGEQVHRDRYQELIRLFAERAEALGRKLYLGGPVRWSS